MPKKGRKKFIDKKNSITFQVVHRSQRDPLITDETAPQGVFVPYASKKPKVNEERKEEQRKFGVFFDDDYDYLQHLRSRDDSTVDWEQVERFEVKKSDTALKDSGSNSTKLLLPSSVFESVIEEDVGLLNKAAPHRGPRPDLDPDIVATLDDDFGFDYDNPENVLEDNFMELAMASGSDEDAEEDGSDCSSNGMNVSDDESEEDDDVGSLPDIRHSFTEEETKSRFSNYSLSSSVIRRNEQLTLLDDCFEKIYTGYDDNEIGALDCEEIEGYINPNSELLLQCAEQFILSKESQKHDKDADVNVQYEFSDSEDENLVEIEMKEPQEKWDCESILSTYSNLYNHPKLIEEPQKLHKIRVSRKDGIPLDVFDGNKLTKQALARLDASNKVEDKDGTETVRSTLSILSIRPKDETLEEKKVRKRSLKDYRRERRTERKANTLAFKEEKKRQEKVLLNNMKNTKGIHIQ